MVLQNIHAPKPLSLNNLGSFQIFTQENTEKKKEKSCIYVIIMYTSRADHEYCIPKKP